MRTENSLARTGTLIRFNLKRDGLKLLIWLLVAAGLFAAIAAKFEGLYDTQAAIDTIIKTLKTPAMVSLFGAFTATAPYNVAKVFATEMVVFMAIVMVIMNISFAVATTRSEEDAGLLELIRAHAVGRLAPLAAGVVELTGLNLGLGLLYSVGLQLANMPGADSTGNWLIGLGLAMLGWSFGMLTLLLAQLADSAGGATMLSYLVFGLMYVARMATDVSNPRLTWWVPFGWIEKLNAYEGNHGFPLLALGLFGLVCLVLAGILNWQRDLGAGLLPQRLGRARASVILRGPGSLLWRQFRGTLLAWIIGNFVLGASYASIFNTIGDVAKSNPMLKKLLGAHALAAANRLVIKNYIAVLAIVLVVVALIPAIQVMLKLIGDENKGYLHQLSAAAVSRWHVWAGYTGWAVVTGLVVLLAGLCGMYLTGVATLKDPIKWVSFWHVFVAYSPAMLVMIAAASLLAGALPKLRWLAWAWTGYGFLAVYMGALLNLPTWAKRLSPLGFVNKVPIKAIDWSTSWWCLLLTVLLLGLAGICYRRRDLAQ